MDSLRPQDVRPDPIITEWAVKYGVGRGFIADEVAPVVPVAQKLFKFFTYKADELNDEVQTRTAPGDDPSEVRFQKGTTTTIAAERNVLDATISNEMALTLMNPLLGEQRRTEKLVHKLRLGVEKRVHNIFHAATKTTAAGTAWDDPAATALGVRKNIDDAAEALAVRTGGDAINILINVAEARVLARIVSAAVLYADASMFVGGLFPQGLWGYRWHIAGALGNTGAAKADFSQTVARVWSDKEAYLFLTDPNPTLESQGFAFQGNWAEWGQPYAGYSWPDPKVSKKVRWISAENYQIEYLVCDDMAQRITGVLT